MKTAITELFNIEYPVIQGGMIWCSGWELAAAVSNAGGLGLIASGSFNPDELRENIRLCKQKTNNPFGVNVPLLFQHAKDNIQVIVDEKVPVVFTSAGSPKAYTGWLQERGIKVAHVVANVKFARKCEEAGVDAVVAEGFEAGGHNGREETTTIALIPMVKDAISVPLIAAGGIADGRAMAAAIALGADGVQVGTRFAASVESNAHPEFKKMITKAIDGDTQLVMKKLVPVRLLKNDFCNRVVEAEEKGATVDELSEILGRGRAKLGMLNGDIIEGELEIGQVSAAVSSIIPAGQIVDSMIKEYNDAKQSLP